MRKPVGPFLVVLLAGSMTVLSYIFFSSGIAELIFRQPLTCSSEKLLFLACSGTEQGFFGNVHLPSTVMLSAGLLALITLAVISFIGIVSIGLHMQKAEEAH